MGRTGTIELPDDVVDTLLTKHLRFVDVKPKELWLFRKREAWTGINKWAGLIGDILRESGGRPGLEAATICAAVAILAGATRQDLDEGGSGASSLRSPRTYPVHAEGQEGWQVIAKEVCEPRMAPGSSRECTSEDAIEASEDAIEVDSSLMLFGGHELRFSGVG